MLIQKWALSPTTAQTTRAPQAHTLPDEVPQVPSGAEVGCTNASWPSTASPGLPCYHPQWRSWEASASLMAEYMTKTEAWLCCYLCCYPHHKWGRDACQGLGWLGLSEPWDWLWAIVWSTSVGCVSVYMWPSRVIITALSSLGCALSWWLCPDWLCVLSWWWSRMLCIPQWSPPWLLPGRCGICGTFQPNTNVLCIHIFGKQFCWRSFVD